MYTKKPQLTKHIHIQRELWEMKGLVQRRQCTPHRHGLFSAKFAKKASPSTLQTTLLNAAAGRSQVVQRVGSGRREPLVVPEEAAVAAEPSLAEAGEAPQTRSRS